MDKIPFIFNTYHATYNANGHGDQQMLEAIFAGKIPSSVEYERKDSFLGLDGAVIVMPLGHNNEDIPKLNADLALLKWAIVMFTGNEESVDGFNRVEHPNCKIWLQSPAAEDIADHYLPVGFPSFLPEMYDNLALRPNDWFLSGQGTPRREQCVAAFRNIPGGSSMITKGFYQGLPHDEYIAEMCKARIAPCPGGTVHPDTFRLWEALECGCVPIADTQGGHKHWGDASGRDSFGHNFWEKILGETPPFPIIYDWGDAGAVYEKTLTESNKLSPVIREWWHLKKLQIAEAIAADIKQLS